MMIYFSMCCWFTENSETSPLPHGECSGPVVQSCGVTIAGVTDVLEDSLQKKNVFYTCAMRNSDMVVEKMKAREYLFESL